MKTCTKCGDQKAITEFHKHASGRDGLHPYCKVCNNARAAAWRKTNPEKVRATRVDYRAANSEKLRVRNAAYYAANTDKAKVKNAAWRARNPDKMREVKAAWFVSNRDKMRAAHAAWAKENPEKVRAYNAKWYAANPENGRINAHNRRAMMRESGGRLSQNIADKLFKLQRGKCACCGLPLGDNYHRDHIMPLALGGSNTDDNIQLLRDKCNLQKNAKHPVDFMQQRGFLL